MFGILNAVASEKPRILQDNRDIFLTLAVMVIAMVLTVGFTGLCSFNPGRPENGPVQEVDAAAFLKMENRRVPFAVIQPNVPEGWISNSTRAGVAAERQSTIVGYVTPEGAFLQATQTDAAVGKLPADGKARTKGDKVDVEGVSWQVFEPVDDGTRRIWLAEVHGISVMLEGSAGDAEYRALAVAMQRGTVLEKTTN